MTRGFVALSFGKMRKHSLRLEVRKMLLSHSQDCRSLVERLGGSALFLAVSFLVVSISFFSTASASGYALEFDGQGDYVVTNEPYPFINETGEFSASAWVHVYQHAVNTDTWNSVLGRGHAGPFRIAVIEDGRVRCTWDGASRVNLYADAIPQNQWTHILVQGDGSTLQMYVDGALASETDIVPAPQDSVNFAIGTWPESLGQRVMNGIIDDVRLWTRPLTTEEIQTEMAQELSGNETGLVGYWNFNEGDGTTAYDLSPTENHGTITGAVWTTNVPPIAPPVTASAPNPMDRAFDVPEDVLLRWYPGNSAVTHDVYIGMDFESVDEASRSNSLGVLVSQGQDAVTYDPSPLELGQTYYWRIDGVSAAPESSIFKGHVWSFTVEPFAYPLANVVATSNGDSGQDNGPEKTVDGSGLNDEDQHSTQSIDMWLARGSDEPVYIQYEFDRLHKLHEMLVWNYNVEFETVLGFGIKDVTVESSVDGEDWTTLGDFELAQGTAVGSYMANTTIPFNGVAARYVRLTAHSSWGGGNQFGLSEARFLFIPAHARQPQPADGAAGVSVDSTLAWRAGRDAASHEVYFGADSESLTLVETATGNTYDAGPLDLGTRYYWQVNAVQETESWDGAIWSFTTEDYLLLEDFESYTDDLDTGGAIFDTWLDGWVNDTGSTVGYMQAPFAERNTVRSGRQSMPLFYDNSTADCSETTAEVTNLQFGEDWTRHGIASLTLYFHGAPDNSPEQMYVKLNGAKILYDGDADDLKQALWQPWSIDLADFGVDLRSITELSIGFERIGATGGTGLVYFDDIRLASMASTAGTFSVSPWTGDDDSQISSDKVYTHTGKFSGEGADGEPFFAGNGVYFERDIDGSGVDWTLTGPAINVFDTSNSVDVAGDSADLARGFFYGDLDDSHPVLTLSNLVPGTAYVATFYTVGFGGVGERFTDITPGDNPVSPTRIDQNGAGSGKGQLIKYAYIATGTEMSFMFDALVTADSWHHYAFSNEVASSN